MLLLENYELESNTTSFYTLHCRVKIVLLVLIGSEIALFTVNYMHKTFLDAVGLNQDMISTHNLRISRDLRKCEAGLNRV